MDNNASANTKDKHLLWWNSLNYNTKKKFSEGYIMPTDSPVDPVMFLDEETILEIYNDFYGNK